MVSLPPISRPVPPSRRALPSIRLRSYKNLPLVAGVRVLGQWFLTASLDRS